MKFSELVKRPESRSRLLFAAGALLFAGTASASSIGLTITPTFDSTITGSAQAAQEEAAINAAISTIEGAIASPYDINVSIYFNAVTSGLGGSSTAYYGISYDDYYNAYKAIATSPAQLTALASLGTAPTSESSNNPVTGTPNMAVTSAECRNLGGNCTAAVEASNDLDYDTIISLNTHITSPPNGLSGNYSLESVAMHEIDESLGIGGTGSTLGDGLSGNPAGDLDLFRYTAPGVRSYSTTQTTSPYSYFSINGGTTALSYFNQTTGADYADWLSNPIPNGYGVQVQDAFGTPGTAPTLGTNELTAFNVIGYDVLAPEPSTFALLGLSLILGMGFVRRRQTAKPVVDGTAQLR